MKMFVVKLELKDGIAPSLAEYETAVLLLNYSSIVGTAGGIRTHSVSSCGILSSVRLANFATAAFLLVLLAGFEPALFEF